jgi:glycine/D-amino acid oxidase-like deaminating enzyme
MSMDRRTLIKASGMALTGFGIGACGPRKVVQTVATAPVPTPVPRLPVNLVPPRISWNRVIRTTIGLRPHRDSGFVLKPEKFDSKTVIHDYGFGGAGMSLAWGCGAMAADMCVAQEDRRIAVLGCGSPGLTAARQLQRRGFDVTIYTLAVPPYTTSNMSMAGFTPTAGLVSADKRTPAWDAQFRQAAEISYRELQLLSGTPGYGVYWIDSYTGTDDPDNPQGPGSSNDDGDLVPELLRPNRDREVLGPGEHPFPTKYAIRSPALAIEPSIYLAALVRDFLLFGGKVVIRKFDTPRDLMPLEESVIVNCTGLGSKTLFNDDELVPVRGQLTVCVPQPEVKYRASGRVPGSVTNASMNPRSDGLVIGNMMERGNYSLEPNAEVRQQNVDAAIEYFGRMRAPIGGRLTSSGMPRGIPALESFYGLES